ncbi:MAG: CopG family transcriptional regulator [Candidatus Rokuibacteriota bacterium]
MKTTLVIDDTVLNRLRREAARQGRTISELVEAALRQFLAQRPAREGMPDLPAFDSGGAYVDVADREALYQAMERP